MQTQQLPMEHRWGQRIDCRAHVRITVGENPPGVGRVRNVSTSGAFVESTVAMTEGSQVTLLVMGNESAPRAVEIPAIVVRVERDGFAAEWCETPAGSICARIGCTTSCAALSASQCGKHA
jgi:hypothetical protein